jgi:hypothetical protein
LDFGGSHNRPVHRADEVGIRLRLVILPISVIAFFSGQLLGAKLRHPIGKVIAEPTSNLFRDVTHFFRRPAFDED